MSEKQGKVGPVDLRTVWLPPNQTVRVLDPVGRDAWVCLSTRSAAPANGTGVFYAVKRKYCEGSQRVEILSSREILPLGAKQALWVRCVVGPQGAGTYLNIKFWDQVKEEG